MTINYREVLMGYIDILTKPLKEEAELIEVLKRRLTKKELKVLKARENNIPDSETALDIKADEQRVDTLFKGVVKKLNQEKIKQELMVD